VSSSDQGFDLSDVTVDYGDCRALDRVRLRIARGERVALIGPSGAGKTTLLRLLAGAVRPSSGSVRVDGRALAGLSGQELRRFRASIGFVHQDLRLVPNLRAVRNVVAGRLGRLSLLASLRALLFPPAAMVHEAYELLDRVGIPDKLFQRTDRLSGGEQQRVAIARALFQQPTALVADEPVASVDPARAADTLALLTDLCRERRLTLCVSLHDLDLARASFPRLIGLRHGRIVFDGAPDELRRAQLDALYRFGLAEGLADAG
jgi:phosphonate transport system ATP-binding protein